MHKFSLIFIALLAILPNIKAGVPDKKLHEECLYPIVKVNNYDNNAYGTGTIIRSDKINDKEFRNVVLTCAHLGDIEDEYKVTLYKYSNWSRVSKTEKFPIEIYAIDHSRDLSIGVFISERKMPTATIDFSTNYYIGNKAFRIGCGSLDLPRLDNGVITAIDNRYVNPYIRTSIYTVAGDSGSPLFHNYKIIGVVRAIRIYRGKLFQKMSYAAPITGLKKWSEEKDNFLNFSWDKKAQLPKMPYLKLKMKEYRINKIP